MKLITKATPHFPLGASNPLNSFDSIRSVELNGIFSRNGPKVCHSYSIFFFWTPLSRGYDKHMYLPLKSLLSKPVPFSQAAQMNDVIGWILPGNVHLLSRKAPFFWALKIWIRAFPKVKCQKSHLSFTDDEEGVSSSALSDYVFSIAIVSLGKVGERKRERAYVRWWRTQATTSCLFAQIPYVLTWARPGGCRSPLHTRQLLQPCKLLNSLTTNIILMGAQSTPLPQNNKQPSRLRHKMKGLNINKIQLTQALFNLSPKTVMR